MAVGAPSMLRTIRALAEAHGRATLNATLRDGGPLLTVLALTATAVLLVMMLGVFGVGFFGVGFLLASDTPEQAFTAAAWLFTTVPLSAAIASMLGGDARSLDWEKLKAYPVAPPALFLAELVASLVQLMMAVGLLSMLAFTAGAVARSHALFPAMVVPLAVAILVMVGLHSLLGTLAGYFVRRLRIALILLMIMTPAPLLAYILDPALARWFEGVLKHAKDYTPYLPAAWGLDVNGPLSAGRHLVGFGAQALLAGLLLWVAYRVAFRDLEPTQLVNAKPERLWSHSSRVVALARVTLLSIVSSDIGRFQVVTPVIFSVPIILLRLKLSMLAMVRADFVFFSVCVMTPTMLFSLSLNQFGTDRGAVKALLLLPISARELLLGKALGNAVVLLLNLAVLLPIVIILAHPPLISLVTAPLAGGSLFLIGLTVGQFTSIGWPRPVPLKGLSQPQGGPLVGAVSLALLFGVSAPVALVSFWLRDDPGLLTMMLLGLVAAAGSLFYGGLQLAERFLISRSERLVESLS